MVGIEHDHTREVTVQAMARIAQLPAWVGAAIVGAALLAAYLCSSSGHLGPPGDRWRRAAHHLQV